VLLNGSLWSGLLCLVLPLAALGLAFIWWLLSRQPGPAEDKGTRPVTPPPPRGPYLEGIGTAGPRRLYLSPQGSIIGRAPGGDGVDLLIDQAFPNWETVSRRHARIYLCNDEWAVEDLGSLNGVYVNGRRTGHNLLRDGWQVDIGGVQFVFRTGNGRRDDEMS
ncbi:MAG TPA: FHA domain-containing protein, partial [Anaerolineae bacterium]|nr:FHA domain-containing protein [Anaerolineae bacterium]